jgi:hypothetical protein
MNSVMTLKGLATQHLTSSRVRVDEQTRSFWVAKENACLTHDNTRLRSELKDLEASTIMWIRLYEAALERANAAAAECARLRQQTPQGR